MALKAVAAPLGSPVGGSGTTNTIPRWTGASTLGDSGLIDNGTAIYTTTRNVGIGLSLPSAPLHVQGPLADWSAKIQGNTTSGSSYGLNMRAGTTAADTSLRLQNAAGTVEHLFVRGDGNVGIGTTPNAWNSAIRAFDLRTNSLWNFNSGSDSAAYWTVNAYIDTVGNVVYKNSAAASQYTQIGGAHVWYRAASGAAGAACSLIESARIDSNGNFAVGRVPTAGTIFETQGDQVTFRDGAGNVRFRFEAANSLLNIGIGSGWGLKLPATPGNADTQTLDAYKESTTWAPTVTWGTGGTVTTTSATGAYTQIGNVVTFTVTIAYNCSVVPTGGSIAIDLPRTSATGFNQRPGLWAFNAWNGVAGSNFLSIGSASTTATLRVANATGTADIATYLTVTASGALVITATYLAS